VSVALHTTLGRLLQAIDCKLPIGKPPIADDITISSITNDSRKVSKGCLFIAYPGSASDGRDYITAAIAQGAVAIIQEESGASLIESTKVPIINITGLTQHLATLAGEFYHHRADNMHLTGITGTNGKTSVSSYIAQGLELLGEKSGVIGTLGYGAYDNLTNTGLTTPDALYLQQILWQLSQDKFSHIALEVSSHAIAQHRIKGLEFNTLVFTNLTQDHLDYHISMQAYKQAKFNLFSQYKYANALINIDSTAGCELFAQVKANKISYSLEQSAADIYASNIEQTLTGMSALVTTPGGTVTIKTRLLGRFNLSNLLAAIGVWQLYGASLATIAQITEQIEAVAGRMQLISAPEKPQIVIDYAHTPDALKQALLALQEHRQLHSRGKLYCVFGCGGNRDKTKRPLMGKIANKYADYVIVTNDNPRDEDPGQIIEQIIAGIDGHTSLELEPKRAKAIERAISLADKHDWILIAGKGHEDYQEISGERVYFSDLAQVKKSLKV
jgi:UDP-N-acetylmuramoyl-L-alanyl-D-glutamate--2,6-diaminopimelate ligase